tara:strand:- start:4657 stop:5031 length:375 start_codon:yes stop_codon:yes gene_type:complete
MMAVYPLVKRLSPLPHFNPVLNRRIFMCLGIPGQIISISDATKKLGMIDVSGVQREVNLACIMPEDGNIDALIGEWALVHVGFAMSRIDEEEAAKTMEVLLMLGEAQEEIEAMRRSQLAMEKNG